MSTEYENGSARKLEDGDRTSEDPVSPESYQDNDPTTDAFWVSRSRSAYTFGKDWFDASVRGRMEDALHMFNNRHPKGSKYSDPSYQKRSNLFRPKTRTGVRKTEAAAAAAFFATEDAVSCAAPNPNNPHQRLGAKANTELLNLRLKNDIPWFVTCLAALQDAAKQGVVISKQEWKYEEVDEVYDDSVYDDATGEVLEKHRVIDKRVVADHPTITLRPAENIIISPASDWLDPINSSPYLIDLEPWFVGDVKTAIKRKTKGGIPWRDIDIEKHRGDGGRFMYDPLRAAREGRRQDRYEETASGDTFDHDVVWLHHNYMRIDGEDWYWVTLGTEILMSDPVPIGEITPLGRRPYTMGIIVIESHKIYPDGLVTLGKPTQDYFNDLTNLRIDNIRHVLSPRYFVKKGQQTDFQSLLRNVPGGVTAMENPKEDVVIRQIQDVTGGSHEETDRLSIEYDELIGTFNQSSVAANQNINERVGSTMMVGEAANQVTELNIRTFAETWVEPTLQQVMELEQNLESNEVLIAVVGQSLKMPPEAVFRMLDMPVKVTVNVGFGATNPQLRLQKVVTAFGALGQINPQWLAEADKAEVISEVLGAVGFKSAERFFPGLSEREAEQDPQVARLTEENNMLRQMLEGKGQELQFKAQIEDKKLASKERLDMAKLEHTKAKDMTQAQLSQKIEENRWQSSMLDFQIKRENNAMRKQELVQQRIALNHTITMDERQYALTQQMQEFQIGQEAAETEESERIPGEEESGDDKEEAQGPGIPAKAKGIGGDGPPGGRRIATQPKLGGDDKAGVIARGNYGGIPFREG